MAKKKVTKRAVKRKTPSKQRSSSTVIKIPQLPIRQRLDPFALAYTLACVRALFVIVVSIVKSPGLVEIAQKMHFTYSLSFSGIITGIAETAIWGLVMGFVIGWLYNKFV